MFDSLSDRLQGVFLQYELAVDDVPDGPVVGAEAGVPLALFGLPPLRAAGATDLPLDHLPGHDGNPRVRVVLGWR